MDEEIDAAIDAEIEDAIDADTEAEDIDAATEAEYEDATALSVDIVLEEPTHSLIVFTFKFWYEADVQ